jgi:hypothetical protein
MLGKYYIPYIRSRFGAVLLFPKPSPDLGNIEGTKKNECIPPLNYPRDKESE